VFMWWWWWWYCRKKKAETMRKKKESMHEKDPARPALYKLLVTTERELKLDQEEYKLLHTSINQVLLQALENYAKALELADGTEEPSSDLGPVFVVVALWFDADNVDKDEVNEVIWNLSQTCPTYKLVPLVYQLLSRLGTGSDSFREALRFLLTRMCRDHPHHTLLQLFALCNGKRVVNEANPSYDHNMALTAKVQAAQKIRKDLIDLGGQLSQLIRNTERLLDGYIELIDVDTKRVRSMDFGTLKSSLKTFQQGFRRCREDEQLSIPCVITLTPPLCPDGHYDPRELVRVQDFEQKIVISDAGVSRPMFVGCRGTDGKTYKQVVKKDEVRQDAIMMQVRGSGWRKRRWWQ